MALMFPTCQQIDFFLCMSALYVSQGLLYIGPDIIFGIFLWRVPPTPPTLAGPPPWGPRKPGTRLKVSASPGQLGSGGAPCRSAVCWQPLFSCPRHSLILPFYFQPASEYNTEEPCAVLRHTDTHPWAYTHIHTFISHWKRQDQRRKEEQTPLRCWAWLRVPLDTDGRTQDNCCLLFMEGPSATLHALFIWRLLKGHSQEPQGKRKMGLTVSTVCAHVCMKESACTPLRLHVQAECALTVQSWALLFFGSFRVEYVLFAQLELVQCGGDGAAILFHSHNKVITAGEVYFLSNLIDDGLLFTMLCNTYSTFWDAFSVLITRLRGKVQKQQQLIPSIFWLCGPIWYLKRQY